MFNIWLFEFIQSFFMEPYQYIRHVLEHIAYAKTV